jgi:flavodoxin
MKTSDEILLSSLFDRFTKYLNDNDSNIVFKYENNKVKYCIEDNQHKAWYDWYDIYDPIKDIDFKDEHLNFFIGEHDSFFHVHFVINLNIKLLINV